MCIRTECPRQSDVSCDCEELRPERWGVVAWPPEVLVEPAKRASCTATPQAMESQNRERLERRADISPSLVARLTYTSAWIGMRKLYRQSPASAPGLSKRGRLTRYKAMSK